MKFEAAIFDWAGTIIDYGCRAPIMAFSNFFQQVFDINISYEDISKHMGMNKKDHLSALLAEFKDDEISRLELHYKTLNDILLKTLESYSEVIPGALSAVDYLKSLGLKIGSSTGYPSEAIDILKPLAENQGYKPDFIVSSSDVEKGRPNPAMCYANSLGLDVYPMNRIVKIGDTISDIQAGKNAGCKTIGVILGGNLFGAGYEDVQRMAPEVLSEKMAETRNAFIAAGADAVASSIMEVPSLIHWLDSHGQS